MNANLIASLTELDDELTKNYPELQYEGIIPTDADEMDFVNMTLKGVTVA